MDALPVLPVHRAIPRLLPHGDLPINVGWYNSDLSPEPFLNGSVTMIAGSLFIKENPDSAELSLRGQILSS